MMRIAFAVPSACLLLALAAPLAAQLPFGTATAAGGSRAELFAEPLWFGNLGYGYRIENGPPGGAALLVVSVARRDTMLLGLQVYPGLLPGEILRIDAGTLDAAGRLQLPHPLGGPEIPALAGLNLHAQAMVAVGGTLGSTQGLLLEAVLHPMLAYGNASTGLFLFDLALGTTTPVAGVTLAMGISDAVFGNGGRDLFLAANEGVFVVDTTAPVPTATPLVTGQACTGIAWDRVHKRLFVTRHRLEVIDGDRASPTFGVVIAHVPPIFFTPGRVAVTTDGTRLVHATPLGHFQRFDVDPASATYLQGIPTPLQPVPPSFGMRLDRVHASPDGTVLSVVNTHLLFLRTDLNRYDVAADAWIDHDPNTAGVQPLSHLTHALVPSTFGWLPTRDGSAAYISGGTGSLAMDLQLGGPAFDLLPSPLPPTTTTSFYLGASPTGRYLLRYTSVLPQHQMSLVDVVAGTAAPLTTMPVNSTPSILAWR
jgi:hypothetical protein